MSVQSATQGDLAYTLLMATGMQPNGCGTQNSSTICEYNTEKNPICGVVNQTYEQGSI